MIKRWLSKSYYPNTFFSNIFRADVDFLTTRWQHQVNGKIFTGKKTPVHFASSESSLHTLYPIATEV